MQMIMACFYAMLSVSASFAANVLTDGDFEQSTPNGTFPDSGHWSPGLLPRLYRSIGLTCAEKNCEEH